MDRCGQGSVLLRSSPERKRTWLLPPQGDQRIYPRGAAGGYGAGEDGDGHE